MTVLRRDIDQLKDLAKTESVYDPLRELLNDHFDQFEELDTEENI